MRHDSRFTVCAILWLALLCFAGNTLLWSAELPPTATDFGDADLTSIVFLDPDRGCAVGDKGALWQTSDGGRSWRPKSVPASGRWNAIHFQGAKNGWIAGGKFRPFTGESAAELLFTTDGGETWKTSSLATIPALNAIQFQDEKRGWAAGEPSAMYPSGLFRTENGGRTWTAVPNFHGQVWQSLSLREAGGGLAVAATGETAMLLPPNARTMPQIDLGLRKIRKVKLVGTQDGWLVGDGGLILRTRDAGLSWQTLENEPPAEVSAIFNFTDIAVLGSRIWIVGSPGSRIWHSPDGGKHWQSQNTGCSLPLNGVTFLDEQRGWACGALGTILATRDGGRTWVRQHSGGLRTAVLGLFGEAESAPWEVLAQLCGNDGYLGAVELLHRRDIEAVGKVDAAIEARSRAAMTAVGVTSMSRAWQFPLRQQGLMIASESTLAGWDELHARGALAALEAHLVQRIRQWRPDVILAEDVPIVGNENSEAKTLAGLIQNLISSAVSKAEDERAFPELIEYGGLSTWRVKKLFFVGDRETANAVVVNTAQLATRLGKPLSAAAAWSRGVAIDEHGTPPAQFAARLAMNRIPQDAGRRELMSGIVIPVGSDARRAQSQVSNSELRELTRTAQQQRNLQTLLAKGTGDGQQGAAWLAQMNDLLHGVSKPAAADLLFQLALRFHTNGKPDLAAETMHLLVEKYPDEDLAAAALVWLIQMQTSGEVLRRLPQVSQLTARGIAAVEPQNGDGKSVSTVVTAASVGAPTKTVANGKAGKVVQANESAMQPESVAALTVRPREPLDAKALGCGTKLDRLRPALSSNPEVRFPLVAAQRRFNRKKDAELLLGLLATRNDAWAECAATELAILGGKVPVRTHVTCIATNTRPHLDGKLDEPFWQRAKPLELKSSFQDDEAWPATVLMVRDDEYLYVAIRCDKAKGCSYPITNVPRSYDADLSRHDRVELCLDVDRDYATYFRLVIDHRGWVNDSCVGDPSWNPTWFVAADSDEMQWRVEAAIAWKELAAASPALRETWALGVQRIVPGVGFQSWTQPAAVKIRPEGFGLLMFE